MYSREMHHCVEIAPEGAVTNICVIARFEASSLHALLHARRTCGAQAPAEAQVQTAAALEQHAIGTPTNSAALPVPSLRGVSSCADVHSGELPGARAAAVNCSSEVAVNCFCVAPLTKTYAAALVARIHSFMPPRPGFRRAINVKERAGARCATLAPRSLPSQTKYAALFNYLAAPYLHTYLAECAASWKEMTSVNDGFGRGRAVGAAFTCIEGWFEGRIQLVQ
ncbi:hypothetical protein FB451DRAFT_1192450 [Mycena latifolia]|nr:hypothetical protein FB451DRAFT_1192450 [Mycena latifolia]